MIEQSVSGIISENPEVERILIYYTLGKELGWSKQEIDSLDTVMVQDLLILISTIKKKENEDMKNAGK